MLVIISDLHLTDGSSGTTIGPGAFKVFRSRLGDLAYDASWRSNGKYKPIEEFDVILLGDILDVIRSTAWVPENQGGNGVRPWDRTLDRQGFRARVSGITAGILQANTDSLEVLENIGHKDAITIPQATKGQPKSVDHDRDAAGRQAVKVNIHYLVGNHDWFFHLADEGFNDIRAAVVKALGLANPPDTPFPHDPEESSVICRLYREHRVYARHGDIYDPFNYEDDRDASSLGDAIVIELLNRFAQGVAGDKSIDLNARCLAGLREVDNVRPLLLVPVWINGLLDQWCADKTQAKKVKQVWDGLVDEFLKLPFVRARDKFFQLNDLVDKLERGLRLSTGFSLRRLSQVLVWWNEHVGTGRDAFYKHALGERAFRNRNARFIVYGHTHRHEVVPLDSVSNGDELINQIYLNSGTWRRVHELARSNPKEQEFIDYDVMTYLAFFKEDERGGRRFESWSGVLDPPPHRAEKDAG
ncbi:MAG: hypothetical protein IID40_01710 [Planctomycetes bacterium]|nr:hypothetical protein [Planctomycetota bacterium]